ncbi:MAG: DUF2069 domain-containing protein [Gammaproteobacteria bacterium]|jgi:uncharacterized membrane protein|uniref:DUF2069 domain-containing protein n=1 Tax=Methyloprofundus sp. TaxID=2020875 RepID=UPI0017C674F9|nr:DUF2069 domain-containing protein [Methyloprofundus sp.]MBT3811698.1 DUF2069 domain-containing protein [Gammaproteobacteria bacterium]HIL79246.1 DUF2069 domain-containing protein [Methylococcales bacterium]MBT4147577.1 DUF2069 domain-containing protein [Gammaproteobacteria bacterium]MBT5221306.1 DUF2069 domain-containing protein [Gammaproteobacteria bacterium]MBT5825931.1 DUF2069 domain-containing protein [Gammaproteobacteria bacterium]
MNARYFYTIALSGYVGLFILLMLWNTVISPPEKLPIALALIITVSPLLLPFRGFIKGNLKSCSWMAYLSMPYFIHGSIEAYARTERLLPALEVLFSLLLFLGATLFVRYAARKQ